MRITSAQLAAKRSGKPLPRPEGDVQKAIFSYLATLPEIMGLRMNSGVARVPGRDGRTRLIRFGGVKGISDIIGWRKEHVRTLVCMGRDCSGPLVERDIFGGEERHWHYHLALFPRWLAIEVKAPGEKPTREQAAFLDMVRKAGGIAIVATCIEDVVRALRA